MNLELNRHYYDREDRIWRVVCVDGYNSAFPVIAINPTKEMPMFESGQEWGNEDYSFHLEKFENGKWLTDKYRPGKYEWKLHPIEFTEKYLLENYKLIEEEVTSNPNYGDWWHHVVNFGGDAKTEIKVPADPELLVLSKLLALQVEVMGMQAENSLRMQRGETVAYNDKEFFKMAEKIRAYGDTTLEEKEKENE